MSKKLGLAFMFVGAYITILGGLFFLMHFYGDAYPEKPADYSWVWGVLTGIIIVIGACLACKKYAAGFVGFGVSILGAAATMFVAFYFLATFNYLSPILMTGAICTLFGSVVGIIFHAISSVKAKKYGESLL